MTSERSRDVVVVDMRCGALLKQDRMQRSIEKIACHQPPQLISPTAYLSVCLSIWSADPADWSVAGQHGQVDNTIISHCSARRLTMYRIAATQRVLRC